MADIDDWWTSFKLHAREKFQQWREGDRSAHKIDVGHMDDDQFNFKSLLRFLGPGMLVSIAYLDPGNFLSDIQSGAAFNYRLIWVLWMATLLGLLMQILSARLGIVTGKHLALMCREEYGNKTPTTVCLWLLCELAIIASDIPEVVGSAFGMNLVFGLPLWAGVLIVSVNTFLLLGVQYFGVRKLEGLVACLVAVIAMCFLGEAIISPIAWMPGVCASDEQWGQLLNCSNVIDYCPENYCGSVLGGFIPHINLDFRMILIATSLIGAVVMPHNLYLHSALVLSRDIDRTKDVHVKWADLYNTIECAMSLGVACLVNTTVILVSAAVFFPNESNGYRVVPHLDGIGFLDASELLDDTLGGKWGSIMFGIALLASGQSSTVTGTYAGQFVMEGFIEFKIELWKRNLITRSVAILPSLVICLAAGTEGANTLIIVSSVILSFQLPYALIPLLKFTSSESIMGPHKNSRTMVVTCTVLTVIVLAANLFLITNTIFQSSTGLQLGLMTAMFLIFGTVYFVSLGYLAWRPIESQVYHGGQGGEYQKLDTDEDTVVIRNTTVELPHEGSDEIHMVPLKRHSSNVPSSTNGHYNPTPLNRAASDLGRQPSDMVGGEPVPRIQHPTEGVSATPPPQRRATRSVSGTTRQTSLTRNDRYD